MRPASSGEQQEDPDGRGDLRLLDRYDAGDDEHMAWRKRHDTRRVHPDSNESSIGSKAIRHSESGELFWV